MCNYLSKPGSTYYFRRLVPVELQAHLGRKEWSFSLRTKDRSEAKRLAQAEAVRTNGLIDAARAELASPAPVPASLARDRSRGPSRREQAAMAYFDRETAERDWRYDDRAAVRTQLEDRLQHYSSADLPTMEAAARDLIRAAEHRATMAEEQALALRYDRQERERASAAVAPAEPVTVAGSEDRTKGTMLGIIIERWYAERKVTAKTRAAAEASVRWFYERVGPVAVEQITRKDMLTFKDKLLSDGTSIPNTKMKLSRISGLLGYALDNDLIQINHAKDIKLVDLHASKAKRIVYSAEALATFFGGPVHTKGERPQQGRGEAAYWLPLLALYTGARLEELGQLRPKDVREQAYHDGEDKPCKAWVISIVEDEADGLHLKNAGSTRVVPVHPILIKLGFVELVKAAVDNKQARIFNGLTPDSFGSYTAKWGMWFTTYRKSLGLVDKRLVFHSFRHTFKDAARHGAMIEGIQRQIMGHSGEDVADDYGSGHGLYRLVEAMNLYRVPGFAMPARVS